MNLKNTIFVSGLAVTILMCLFPGRVYAAPTSTEKTVDWKEADAQVVQRDMPKTIDEPLFGIGYVGIKEWATERGKDGIMHAGERQSDGIVQAKALAQSMKAAGMNCIALCGPYIFYSTDITPEIAKLVKELKRDSKLKVFFSLNTFLDFGNRMKDYSWIDQSGGPINNGYICLQRARKARVPEIEKTLRAAMDTGFDGAALDFFDWGTNNLQDCYCPECIEAFNAYNHSHFDRASLVKALNDNDGNIMDAWYRWKTSIRESVARELIDYARKEARSRGKAFVVHYYTGGIGSEPAITARESMWDAICPMTYGSVSGGTIDSPKAIYDAYSQFRQAYRDAGNSRTAIYACLNAGWGDPPPYKVPAKEMRSLAIAAMKGGADG